LKLALVHDWLDTWGGAENVLVELRKTFPEAPVYTLVDFLDESDRALLGPAPVFTSMIQHLPGARSHFRRYLPLFPAAMRRFDLDDYDVILSNSHAVAKFAHTGKKQLNICYCHTPMRYAWDLRDRYLTDGGLGSGLAGFLARSALERIRRADLAANAGIHRFVGNSQYIAARIRRCYHRDADVIYPPVDTARFVRGQATEDYFVTVSRLVPYKQVDALVQAFAQMPDRRLVVAGSGPKLAELRATAPGNVELRGYVSAPELLPLMQGARAFLFAAEEDFGIAPLEAQACGLPVIALGRGGVAETVRDDDSAQRTGVFFSESTPTAIAAAVRRFEAGHPIDPEACRINALRFSRDRFRDEFRAYVDTHWAAFRSGRRAATAPEPDVA
jgi:glycosyltransferase involved in cell wall biosynthesis